ncbi:putative flavoprotein involved in K+ transport [Agromyces cerinus]|uniref:flavin-containing monooxygenase n=1 Tax=Agromyces cerinus TaxID=33878 RepID=UPI001957F5F1|nr:NAD(P)/FAD-dependent oxidoreductase [Agromyces cerinus]MBM7829513.1 putative flavoprotein involved in K+ transport [Agromyces cerinus]
MRADVDVLVIGAGQAGLAVSHGLSASGVDHVVLERDRAGAAWDARWDSFRLVTPNHTIRLPGGEYRGDDPAGYLDRDGIGAHLRDYASSFAAPIQERTGVESLRSAGVGDGFVAETSAGGIRAHRVVVCTGAYQREHRPGFIEEIGREVPVVAATEYRAPHTLPDGTVLVIGGGQSGCQIVHELVHAGRRVVLAASRAPAMPRRVDGRDIIDWLGELGFFDDTLADMPSPAVRNASNPLISGAHGGHEVGLRTLAADGVELIGHVTGVDGARVRVADDLAESVAFGDDVFREVCSGIGRLCWSQGLPVPDLPEPPSTGLAAATVPLLDELGAVVNAVGFRPDYGWIDMQGIVDDMGFPLQEDGASARMPGLSFVGVPWMRTRRSPLLLGVGEDADVVVRRLAAR